MASDVDSFLRALPHDERESAVRLRRIILTVAAGSEERLSYGVPYYFGFRRICFVWPGSVPGGGPRAEGVKLGFCYGSEFQSESELLTMETRKQVAMATFRTPDEIDEVEVSRCVILAVECDRRMRELARRPRADES